MNANFNKSLDMVLKHEGGWSNHPADPGGATMRGVTQRVYTAYRSRKGLSDQSVRFIDIVELRDIYNKQYWSAVMADELPAGLDYAVFDYAVNSGPSRAIKDLQRVLGVKVDGHIGQATIEAANRLNTVDVVNALMDRRMVFLRSLKTFSTFGKGWTSRVEGVRFTASAMAGSPSPNKAPETQERLPAAGKADEANVKVSKQEGFMEKVIAGVTSGGAGVIAAMQGVDWRIGVTLVVVAALGATAYVIFYKRQEG